MAVYDDLPLDRAHVTRASRVMLPTYVGLFAALGLNWVLTSRPRLLASPGLAYLDGVVTIRVWGLSLLAIALLMAAALLTRRRRHYQYALWLAIVCFAALALALLAASIRSDASPTAAVWPLFVVRCCRASERSLAYHEGM